MPIFLWYFPFIILFGACEEIANATTPRRPVEARKSD